MTISQSIVLLVLFFALAGKALAERTSLSSDQNRLANKPTEANQLWKKFMSCGGQEKTEKFVSQCLKETLSKSLTKAEVSKAYEFLAMGFEVSDLMECSAEQKKRIVLAKNKSYQCFKIFGNTSEIVGTCHFEREKGILKISRIKY